MTKPRHPVSLLRKMLTKSLQDSYMQLLGIFRNLFDEKLSQIGFGKSSEIPTTHTKLPVLPKPISDYFSSNKFLNMSRSCIYKSCKEALYGMPLNLFQRTDRF